MSRIREDRLRAVASLLGRRIRALRKDLHLAQSANAYLCSDQAMQDLRDNLARVEDERDAERQAQEMLSEACAKALDEMDALRAALVCASDYVENISGTCPLDAVAGYECPHQKDCSNEMATCWREYFLARRALGKEDSNA